MKKNQERLIEITADGIIEDDEIRDFVQIQKELEHISITVETLQLWVEEMIADNKIDIEEGSPTLQLELNVIGIDTSSTGLNAFICDESNFTKIPSPTCST